MERKEPGNWFQGGKQTSSLRRRDFFSKQMRYTRRKKAPGPEEERKPYSGGNRISRKKQKDPSGGFGGRGLSL